MPTGSVHVLGTDMGAGQRWQRRRGAGRRREGGGAVGAKKKVTVTVAPVFQQRHLLVIVPPPRPKSSSGPNNLQAKIVRGGGGRVVERPVFLVRAECVCGVCAECVCGVCVQAAVTVTARAVAGGWWSGGCGPCFFVRAEGWRMAGPRVCVCQGFPWVSQTVDFPGPGFVRQPGESLRKV
jgi:hypothetical protein